MVYLVDTSSNTKKNGGTLTMCKQDATTMMWEPKRDYPQMLNLCNQAGTGNVVSVNKSTFLRHDDDASSLTNTNTRRTVALFYAVAKTAGTTIRVSIKEQVDKTCEKLLQKQKIVNVKVGFFVDDTLKLLLQNCTNQSVFAVPTLSNLDWKLKDFPPNINYIHIIPFREFNSWSDSCVNQILKSNHQKHKDEWVGTESYTCDLIRNELNDNNCSSFHELNYYSYTKNQINEMITKNYPGHIVMYEYISTNEMFTYFLPMVGLKTIPLKNHNKRHYKGSCPPDVLESFHSCFDHKLTNQMNLT